MPNRYENAIHFVIADNSGFHPDSLRRVSHTPAALKLAAALNRIGNPSGVFVHYITPEAMARWLPGEIQDPHPFAHVHQGRV